MYATHISGDISGPHESSKSSSKSKQIAKKMSSTNDVNRGSRNNKQNKTAKNDCSKNKQQCNFSKIKESSKQIIEKLDPQSHSPENSHHKSDVDDDSN